MKKLLLTLSCLLTVASLTFAANESITFNDNSGTPNAGTYSPTASFSLDVSVAWTGYTAIGLSYWLEVPTALAPFITGTGETYFTWTDPNQTFFGSDPFNQTSGTDPGFMNADRDMGATSVFAAGMNQQVAAAGTHQVSTLNFSLSGAPAGTYELRTLTLTPKISQITEGDATGQTGSHVLPRGVYTITVVPEPATWSLIGLGGLASVGLNVLRRRRA